MAARPGFEPGLPGPEPGVLPLDDLARNYNLLLRLLLFVNNGLLSYAPESLRES